MPDKASELAAIPPLLERLGVGDGLKGALVSIDAVATNAAIAEAILNQGADYLLAVKANQPTLRAEVKAAFAAAEVLDTHLDLDKGHGRVEQRRTSVLRETGWLQGTRRFPGELRLPRVACLVRADTRVETAGCSRAETRYFVSSRPCRRPKPPRRCARTGRSRTAFTGCSTLPSATTSPASGRDTAPETWPPSGTSPSTSYAPQTTGAPSSPGESSPDGLPPTSAASCHPPPHDLDSEPWRRRRAAARWTCRVAGPITCRPEGWPSG